MCNAHYFRSLAALGFLSLGLSGCSTFFTSNDIGFPVKTTPSNATVQAQRLHGSKKAKAVITECRTPCTLTLRQDHSYIIHILKKDYATFVKVIHSEDSIEGDSGSLASNVFSLGLLAPIGMGVDAVSGADDRLFPGHLTVKLKPKTTPDHQPHDQTAHQSAPETNVAGAHQGVDPASASPKDPPATTPPSA